LTVLAWSEAPRPAITLPPLSGEHDRGRCATSLVPESTLRRRRFRLTGRSGLIGSEAVEHYSRQHWDVHGVDNNLRPVLCGPQGDTPWNLARLERVVRNFVHPDLDIRDRAAVFALFEAYQFDLIVQGVAPPSYDKVGDIPLDDFDVNAVGTVDLLEATGLHTQKPSSSS
jgi:CDP-paratose 2-epimerase